jgi:uncharacterized membrane protein
MVLRGAEVNQGKARTEHWAMLQTFRLGKPTATANPLDRMRNVMHIVVAVLCGTGLYVSRAMYAKARRAARGELTEPSVVQRPAARLFGTSNALLGMLYYTALGAAVWFTPGVVWHAAFAASAAAALTSLYLAYSLTFRTKMPCPRCWTSHVVNWLLVVCVLFLRV